MPSLYTNLLGLVLPTTGELNGTWGAVVNANQTQFVEDAVAGYATASLAGGDWTLTTTGGGIANEARMSTLIATGSPGVPRNIFAPKLSKTYTVINKTNAVVTIKGGPGAPTTGVAVAAGDVAVVTWDTVTGDFTSGQRFIPAGAGAVATTVQAKLRERVSVKDFGATGDGITNDYAAIQTAHDSLPADGGEIYFPSGLYSVATKLRITKRNVRFIGENAYNTYIVPTAAVTDAPLHVMGFAFELANVTVYSPSGVGGYCIWSRGAGDMYVHDNVLLNGGPNNTGYAVVLEDVNETGVFVPGAYRHRLHRNTIGPYNNYFSYGIITGAGCTGGGMNACVFSENQLICFNGFSIAVGGGNTYIGNLLQSATGGNSGGRPFTGGAGYGFVFGGEAHFVGNYCERFISDFYPSSSSAAYSVTGHSSDASNDIYVGRSGYPAPAIVATGYGLAAEKLDIQITETITANGTTLRTDRRALRLAGNGSQYTGLLLSTVGAKEGQMLTVYNNSYAMQFAHGGAIDLSGWGDQLVLGQQGLSLLNVTTQGTLADFIFTDSSTWKLLNVGTHGALVGGTKVYNFSGNGETLPTSAAYIAIAGNGAARTGALLAAGATHGQSLTLVANSWSVAFATGAAAWSAAGAPTMGNGAGQVQALQLVWTASGWFEVSRAVRP